ncbi:hypothetical protein PAMC26577_39755 [Caballeronia sordidicola]|uniref:Uncharacterized protein n=1 Tax=Caballeronia sordidicola TaxID=196367 RepID=A0A242M2P1_CABSO|nr:hypothetical protein PAMC26577_39755 [Caballeronia sordidicola]
MAIIFLFASVRCGRHVGSDCAQELLGSFVLPCGEERLRRRLFDVQEKLVATC